MRVLLTFYIACALLATATLATPPAANGEPCSAPDTINATLCESTYCSWEGVCCDSICRGKCRSCIIDGSTGTCTFYDAGTDVKGECRDGDSCNGVELCDGAGGCTRSIHQSTIDADCASQVAAYGNCSVPICTLETRACSSQPDARLGLACGSSNVGACSFGVYECVEGTVTCVGAVLPIAEVADDEIDNDCDGLVDETTPEDCVSVADCQVPASNCTTVTCSSGFCNYAVATTGAVCTNLNQVCWTHGVCSSYGGCVTNDPATLACTQTYPWPNSVDSQCVVGVCNSSGCFSEYYYGPCDDGNPFTVNDACLSSHECSGTDLTCGFGNPCETASYNTGVIGSGPSDVTDYCLYSPVANGTACSLANNENGQWSGVCRSGVCIETFTPVGCDGVVGSGQVYDACGICNGLNETLDGCGVCGGDNSCAGCDGVPYSGTGLDYCGTCGGDNTQIFGRTDYDNGVQMSCDGLRIYASRYTTNEFGGRASSINVYMAGADPTASSSSTGAAGGLSGDVGNKKRSISKRDLNPPQNVTVGIYSSLSDTSPHTIVATSSATVAEQSRGWNEIDLTDSIYLAPNTDYWIAVAHTAADCGDENLFYVYGDDGDMIVSAAVGQVNSLPSTFPQSGISTQDVRLLLVNIDLTCEAPGCDGVPGSNAVFDDCGVCGGLDQSMDACGVCSGDNSTCSDCNGVPNGDSTPDACGVCGGDGSSCAGCDGVPNSGLVNDECGVCNGDSTSCMGCDEVPNSGLVNDACGVCGGDGSTCAGCDGVPNSGKVYDLCGICGGQGNVMIGYNHIGETESVGGRFYVYATKYRTTPRGGQASSLTAFFGNGTSVPPGSYQVGIYSNNATTGSPAALLASSEPTQIIPNSWNTALFTGSIFLSPSTTYWLSVVHSGATATDTNVFLSNNVPDGVTVTNGDTNSLPQVFAPGQTLARLPRVVSLYTNLTCETSGCDGVLGSGKTVDACGVCGGDGSSCAGCDGVPNSGMVLDACNVCNGDGSTCAGCDGIPNSGEVLDACSVCGGNNSTCTGCDGVPNSGLVNDICGVCGGTTTVLADCYPPPYVNVSGDGSIYQVPANSEMEFHSGQWLIFGDGLTVNVLASERINISITVVNVNPSEIDFPIEYTSTGTFYALEPSSTQSDVAYTFVYYYNVTFLQEQYIDDPSTLAFSYFDINTQKWVVLNQTSSVDTGAQTVSVSVDHLSLWTVLGLDGSAEGQVKHGSSTPSGGTFGTSPPTTAPPTTQVTTTAPPTTAPATTTPVPTTPVPTTQVPTTAPPTTVPATTTPAPTTQAPTTAPPTTAPATTTPAPTTHAPTTAPPTTAPATTTPAPTTQAPTTAPPTTAPATTTPAPTTHAPTPAPTTPPPTTHAPTPAPTTHAPTTAPPPPPPTTNSPPPPPHNSTNPNTSVLVILLIVIPFATVGVITFGFALSYSQDRRKQYRQKLK